VFQALQAARCDALPTARPAACWNFSIHDQPELCGRPSSTPRSLERVAESQMQPRFNGSGVVGEINIPRDADLKLDANGAHPIAS
jgi:hypothetical protein